MIPFEDIKRYLQDYQGFYPEILTWFEKVEREAVIGKRGCFWNRQDSEIVALAITRRTEPAKICHLSVHPKAQGKGLGTLLMRRALEDLSESSTIKLTTPGSVYESCSGFFRRFGFIPTGNPGKDIQWIRSNT